ncbi:hypothetical protein J3R82DRAFT_10972 [Butyriboletus roseoflavus]|nr:hypothetical protein J3R82DRAFT_10972 [Butyriboletus roseoflavus]
MGVDDRAQNGLQAPDETTPLLSKSASAQLSDSIQEFMAMELHLQITLIDLQGLLAQTQHEPRLKGPFPIMLYRSILTSLQTILDKLHSMRCVTTREEWFTTVRRDFILPVNKERREMVGNIILYFSTLASAFRLKAPLPPYLPPAEKARERLVDAIRKLDVVKNREVHASRQLLFFAYALTMKGVTQELDYLGHILQDAFGAIGQSAKSLMRCSRRKLEGIVGPTCGSDRKKGPVTLVAYHFTFTGVQFFLLPQARFDSHGLESSLRYVVKQLKHLILLLPPPAHDTSSKFVSFPKVALLMMRTEPRKRPDHPGRHEGVLPRAFEPFKPLFLLPSSSEVLPSAPLVDGFVCVNLLFFAAVAFIFTRAKVSARMSTPSAPVKDESAVTPAKSEPAAEVREQGGKTDEVAVEITDIKASGLPAKVGFFNGLFYVRVKGGKVPQRTKTTRYSKGDEFVATWDDIVKLSGLVASKVEIEVYARRFFFNYKVIKKTESKESLADLLEHSETLELELLEEGQAAGKLTFKISKSSGGGATVEIPPASVDSAGPVPPASVPGSPKQDP